MIPREYQHLPPTASRPAVPAHAWKVLARQSFKHQPGLWDYCCAANCGRTLFINDQFESECFVHGPMWGCYLPSRLLVTQQRGLARVGKNQAGLFRDAVTGKFVR